MLRLKRAQGVLMRPRGHWRSRRRDFSAHASACAACVPCAVERQAVRRAAASAGRHEAITAPTGRYLASWLPAYCLLHL